MTAATAAARAYRDCAAMARELADRAGAGSGIWHALRVMAAMCDARALAAEGEGVPRD